MAEKKCDGDGGAAAPGLARRRPSQRRSRERFERILDCAAVVLAEKGSDGFRMSDIVARTGVPFGSLYQYFPDKTAIIGTLAERYNARGRACVEAELAKVREIGDLRPALARIVDGYYRDFLEVPAMRDIWHATQADKALQALHAAETEGMSELLLEHLNRLARDRDRSALVVAARLVMQLIAAAVRHAITLPRPESDATVEMFKRMLPADLPGIVGRPERGQRRHPAGCH